MRSTEERVAAVKRRMAHIERRKKQRTRRIAALSSVAACFAVIVGVSLALPGISENMSSLDYAGYETAASIFAGNACAGYILIGLLAFVLGVGVTILCIKLKAHQEQEDEETRDDDGGNR